MCIETRVHGGSQGAVTYTSVGIAFLSFLGIVTYHIYMRIKSKVQNIQRGHQLLHRNKKFQGKCMDNHNLEHSCAVTPNDNVTCTEVDYCELRSPLDLLDAN